MNRNNTILLLGSPNTGKSTFFNRVTKGIAQVANYAGTTSVSNSAFLKEGNFKVVDLPGAISITATNPAAKETNDKFLNQEKFSHALAFVSALSIKNDLFNMIDYLEAGGISKLFITQIDEQRKFHIAEKRLAIFLGVNVIPIVSTKVKWNESLKESLISSDDHVHFRLEYRNVVNTAIVNLEKKMNISSVLDKRFIAIQLLMNQEAIFENLLTEKDFKQILKVKKDFLDKNSINYNELIIEDRWKFINEVIQKSCLLTSSEIIKTTDKLWIDKILLNKFLGIIIFIFIMSLVYFLSFSEWTGSYLQAQISKLLIGDSEFIGLIGYLKSTMITESRHWFGITLILDGFLSPIFLVMTFFPYLFIFFILTSIMKQVGYYSRAICVFDSVLERYGLSGHSIISIIAGLGCNLPALMATRSISSKKERHITAFIVPLIPCSARLSVNSILVAMFFHNAYSWLIIIAITVFSGFLWLVIGLVLSKTLFRKEHQWIVLTIPKWRRVDLFSILGLSWKMIKSFIFRMAGYLVLAGVIIFFLSALGPKGINEYTDNGYNDSFIYYISNAISNIFKPLGFGESWQATTALISAIPAKEVVLTTLAATTGSVANIINIFTPATIISFILFSTFYTPCTPAVGILYNETKSTKWLTAIHLVFSFSFAWILGLIVFQLMSI